MEHRSCLYRELTSAELQRIISSAFPGEEIRNHHLLSGGLFNTTYRVITDRQDTVLRMGPVHREVLLPYEHGLMGAEAWIDRLCLENGIPASTVLHLDTSKTIIDRDFMIVRRIESLPLSDPSVPEACRGPILFECGALIRKLHAITGKCFGRAAKILAGKGFSCWYDAMVSEFEDVFQKAGDYALFDPSLPPRVFAFLQARRRALDAVTVPLLAHCDLWAGNILAQEKNGSYSVCAIIDGDRAMFGDPALDLATGWITTGDFLDGYGPIPGQGDGASARNQVYALFFRLQDAYIWKVQYDRQDIFEENLRSILTLLEQ